MKMQIDASKRLVIVPENKLEEQALEALLDRWSESTTMALSAYVPAKSSETSGDPLRLRPQSGRSNAGT